MSKKPIDISEESWTNESINESLSLSIKGGPYMKKQRDASKILSSSIKEDFIPEEELESSI